MESRVKISKKLVAINSTSNIVVWILNATVLIWLQQYLLKRISTEEYSIYPVLGSLIVFLPLFTSVFTAGLARYIVEAYAKGDDKRVTQIVSSIFALLSIIGILVLLTGLVFAWFVDSILTIDTRFVVDARIMFSLMVISFAFNTIMSPFRTGFHVRQKFVLLNMIQIGRELLRIAILFTLLFGVSTRVLWVAVASASANIVGVIIVTFISRRLVPALRFRRSAVNWPVAKELVSFGGWSMIAQLAHLIRLHLDPIILNKLGTPLDVTCFYLGSIPLRKITRLSARIRQPLGPQLTAMHAIEKQEALRHVFLTGNRYGLWASMVITVPLMVFAHELVPLWVGNKFIAAATVGILLLASSPVQYSYFMLGDIARAKAKIRELSMIAIFVQVVNLLLTLYLVGFRHMGAFGSALSTFLTSIILLPILILPLSFRLVDVKIMKWLRLTVFPGLLPAITAASVMLILKFVIKPITLFPLGLCIVSGLVVYAMTLLFFCLQPYDRKNLEQVLRKFIPWIRTFWQ
ncbi:MAG: lipopolysaccharide biosynthesis protein [Planctomycetota bacterium]|jgi:O-antigen/teichoic acid export membrane protein